jgi:hypothetical protein
MATDLRPARLTFHCSLCSSPCLVMLHAVVHNSSTHTCNVATTCSRQLVEVASRMLHAHSLHMYGRASHYITHAQAPVTLVTHEKACISTLHCIIDAGSGAVRVAGHCRYL